MILKRKYQEKYVQIITTTSGTSVAMTTNKEYATKFTSEEIEGVLIMVKKAGFDKDKLEVVD